MSQREILFKAKRTDNGEWVEGWYCKDTFGRWPVKTCIIPWKEAENGYLERVMVDGDTVCQYTGLTDKNGKKIFEGDIVKDRNGEDAVVIYGSFNCGCCYDVFGYTLDGNFDEFDQGIADKCKCGIEVTGNIHDN